MNRVCINRITQNVMDGPIWGIGRLQTRKDMSWNIRVKLGFRVSAPAARQ